jgi:hypothetical protein
MATPITTVLILPLKSGKSLTEDSGSAGGLWSNALSILKGMLGCQRVAWGLQEENKDIAVVILGKELIYQVSQGLVQLTRCRLDLS